MSNWDLMMPGMGLTAIGLAGLTLSYAGIAHTFIDGMHALTGLTMFVGLIFLAAGILDGGVSTSNRAKATTLVIISIALGFGMFALTMNSSDYVITIAGILMAIAFPAIIIAYLAMKHPTIVKPVGSIVGMAAATGIIMWVAFGFVSPDTYMIPQQAGVEEPVEEVAPTGPIFAIEILEGSAEEGAPDYEPDRAIVQQGHIVEWTNVDSVAHTVTSSVDFGETFDSSLISAGEVYTLDTSDLEIGEYEYMCIVHPWMVATLVIEAPKEPTKVIIPEGAAIPEEGQIYYDPEVIDISVGTTVVWENVDNTMHTATSGNPETGADGVFDSDILSTGDSYEFTFVDAGSYDYYCILHPWMIGTVNVE
ncbi:copper-binding protein [Nitrosopumilus sp. b3]|uniref:cupredoxin domain-containing protein n=1 Tax=Nitrosopumilus sp. b3 TaxID=2109909 RepID=UPI0015F54E0F|nr:plastocyanin/azurin family copper-binding protein [Nitrosopumilus sp. b3]KAF6247171.1 copper-binding protein [Nitrosopumilus sp. b3]